MKEKCKNCEAEINSQLATTKKIGLCPICGCDTLQVSSPQSEEWKNLIRSAVETKSAIFSLYENGDGKAEMESLIEMLQSFVGDEIRKAEEKQRENFLNCIPDEFIVHGYMKINHPTMNNDELSGFNECR